MFFFDTIGIMMIFEELEKIVNFNHPPHCRPPSKELWEFEPPPAVPYQEGGMADVLFYFKKLPCFFEKNAQNQGFFLNSRKT